MKNKLNHAYQNPESKFCYYTGLTNQDFAKANGLKFWDWTPNVPKLVEPWYGDTHTIPLAMGCSPRFTSEGKEWVEPCIFSPDDVKRIEVPDVKQGRTGEILQRIAEMLEHYDSSVKIRFPDIQSPLGVAELMWDESFYISLITNPEEVHVLLDKITQFTIQYIKELQRVLGNRANPCCFPYIWSCPEGYYIADDTNSMVSPEMHLEYSVNYINRITEAAGPVHYHSCTLLPHYFDNVLKIRNPKAINWSIIVSCDPAEIIKAFSGKTVLAPHIHLNMHKEIKDSALAKMFRSEYDIVKYLLDNMRDDTTLYLQFYDDLVADTKKMMKIYKLLDDYGYTPKV